MAQKLKDALREMKPKKFQAKPVYSRAGDCLFYYFEEAESYGDRIDGILTVYRSFEDNRIVGCQIKGIATIVQKFGEFGVELHTKDMRLALFFLVSNLVGAESEIPDSDRRDLYSDLLYKVGKERIEIEELAAK
jgi:hypothetical protein